MAATLKPDLTRTWAATAPGANVVDPDVTTPGKYTAGWLAEVPPFEHFNFLQKQFSQGLAHINEQGIAVWDTATTYPVDGIAKGSDGRLYRALLEQNGNNPTSDTGTNWVELIQLVQVLDYAGLRQLTSAALIDGEVIKVVSEKLYGDFIVKTGTVTDNGGTLIVLTDDSNRFAERLLPTDSLNVKWFGAIGSGIVDDSAAIQATLNAGTKVFVPDGTYLIDGPDTSASGLEMINGQRITGQSVNAILLQGTIRLMLTAGTNDGGTTNPDNNKKNIRISNLTLKNNAGTLDEANHLLMISAVSDVVIDLCNFIGYQGDGIYLGSGISAPGIERHNENITIKNCLFDGVANTGRNGISIIDVNGLIIKNNWFINSTKSTMPGPIDFEPNTGNDFAIGKNITIKNNTFEDCQGSFAFVYSSASEDMTVPPLNVKIINNHVSDTCVFTGACIGFDTGQTIDDTTPGMNIVVRDNFLGAFNIPVLATGVVGISIHTNDIDGASIMQIGDSTVVAETILDADIFNNRFKNSGNVTGQIQVGSCKRLSFRYNKFIKPPAATVNGITFLGTAVTTTSENVIIEGNEFLAGSGQTRSIHVASHTFSATTNRFFNNMEDIVLTNSFEYEEDYRVLTYDTDDLPDSFSLGESVAIINGDTGAPDASNQGIILTRKLSVSTSFRKFVVQEYHPANNNATTLKDTYTRKGESASNIWSAWIKVTGV